MADYEILSGLGISFNDAYQIYNCKGYSIFEYSLSKKKSRSSATNNETGWTDSFGSIKTPDYFTITHAGTYPTKQNEKDTVLRCQCSSHRSLRSLKICRCSKCTVNIMISRECEECFRVTGAAHNLPTMKFGRLPALNLDYLVLYSWSKFQHVFILMLFAVNDYSFMGFYNKHVSLKACYCDVYVSPTAKNSKSTGTFLFFVSLTFCNSFVVKGCAGQFYSVPSKFNRFVTAFFIFIVEMYRNK